MKLGTLYGSLFLDLVTDWRQRQPSGLKDVVDHENCMMLVTAILGYYTHLTPGFPVLDPERLGWFLSGFSVETSPGWQANDQFGGFHTRESIVSLRKFFQEVSIVPLEFGQWHQDRDVIDDGYQRRSQVIKPNFSFSNG
jgi:hypothetical protein